MLPLILGLLLTASVNPQVLTVPIVPVEVTLTKDDLVAIATSSAERYHLTKKQTSRMLAVVNCESGWVATSTGKLGERGLAQILPSAHPSLTEEQMIDPYFSLDFLAKNLFVHPSWWSCYGMVTGGAKD